MSKSCLVIGAGIAGLLAATELQRHGVDVVVVDKGRGVGGRMASRRLTTDAGQARADHGAQYFTVRSEPVQKLVDKWLDAGVIREWAQGFYDSDGQPHINGVPRYVGVGGMTAVAKHLAKSLNVQTATRVQAVDYSKRFVARTVDNQLFSGDMLLMTPPAEQTLALIDAGDLKISAEIRNHLTNIQFNPCFALMAVLDRPSLIPNPGGLWPVGGEPISWMADNQQKAVSDLPSITLHASATFTEQHYEDDQESVAQKLLAAAKPWIGDANVVTWQLQRWRYSIPTVVHPERTLLTTSPGPLAFAGDAFGGARVEGAALSGLAAAEALLKL